MTEGHNSRAQAGELRDYVERIERLMDESALIAEQIRDVKKEAKAKGYDSKALAEVIRMRKKDPAKAKEEEDVRAFYLDLMGVFG